jgi:hypothetical protein
VADTHQAVNVVHCITGFVRIRHYGLLGHRDRTKRLVICLRTLGQAPPVPCPVETAAAMMHRLTGIGIEQCPHCHQGRLRIMATVYGFPIVTNGVSL